MSIGKEKSVINQQSRSLYALNCGLKSVLNEALTEFQVEAREAIRKLVYGLFEDEIKNLAGPSYNRSRRPELGIYRAGSDPGSVKAAGQRLAVRKPRLKQAGKEVTLQTYRLLQDKELLTPRVLEFMVHGVSTRNYEDLLDEVAGGLGLSKSTVSRAFSEGSKQALEEFQHRSLKDKKFAVIMVDGIYFASRNVVVAVGIDCLGFKFVLGLRDGNTESAAVCVDLFQDLIKRGLTAEKRFLFVIDGGQGVRAAIRRVFGDDFPVQRCFLHKARNIEEYLPEKEHREFRRRYKKMRSIDTYSQAHDEYKSLRKWLGSIHTSAMNSLDEAGEELLTVHRIGAGPVLRPTITNTNIIESVFSTVRYRSQRVKNWGDSPGKAARWTALCLLHAERSLQRIRGYFECREFIRKIEKIYLPSSPSVA